MVCAPLLLQLVAIKRLSQDLVFRDAYHAKKVYREIVLLKQLVHDNVVKLVDVFVSDPGDIYIVTEKMVCCDGVWCHGWLIEMLMIDCVAVCCFLLACTAACWMLPSSSQCYSPFFRFPRSSSLFIIIIIITITPLCFHMCLLAAAHRTLT